MSSLSRELVLAGTSVNVSDYDGRAALHLAAAEGRYKVAEYLVNKGANVHVKDRWGATPLDEAIRAGVRILLNSFNSYERWLIFLAHRQHKELAALLERAVAQGKDNKPGNAAAEQKGTSNGAVPALVETA